MERLCHHRIGFADYLSDMPLEIGTQFYPPPNVAFPHHLQFTFPLDALEDCYDFDVERNAIDKYQQDAIRRADEQANQFTEIVINQLRNSDDRPSSTSSSTSCDTDHQQQSMMINGGTTSSSFAPIPMLLNDTILQPIPAIDHVARSCTNTRVPLQSTNTPRIWNYEDFETKSANSPFDSLEIKTMDDRALLQLVLNNEQMRRGGSGSGQHP